MGDGIFVIQNEYNAPQLADIVQKIVEAKEAPTFEAFRKKLFDSIMTNPIKHLNFPEYANSTVAALSKKYNGSIYYIINDRVYSLNITENLVKSLLN